MKKITLVSIYSFLFLILCSTVAVALKYSALNSAIEAILIGLVMLLISGVLFLTLRSMHQFNYLFFFTNSVALGFCIRAWHMYRNIDISFNWMIIISLISVLYLLVFYILLYIPVFEEQYTTYMILFLMVSFVAYFIIMFTTKTNFISTSGYYGIIVIAFIFSMSRPAESYEEVFENITTATYSALIVAIIILLIMLECDSFDGIDGLGSDICFESPKNKDIRRKKNPYKF